MSDSVSTNTTRKIHFVLNVAAGSGYSAKRLVGSHEVATLKLMYRSVVVKSVKMNAIQVVFGDENSFQGGGVIRFGIIPKRAYMSDNIDIFAKTPGKPDRIPDLNILPLNANGQSLATFTDMPLGIDWEVAYEQPEGVDPIFILVNEGFRTSGTPDIIAKVYTDVIVECSGVAFGI